MGRVTLRKVALGGAVSLVLLVVLGMGLLLRSAYREHQVMLEREQLLREQVAQTQQLRAMREAYLRRAMSGDREFFERIVRQQLGYVKPGEIVYRFDAPADTDQRD